MSGELDPVVADDVFESLIAAEGGQSPLPRYFLDVSADDVVQAELFEGAVLYPDHSELPPDLPEQEASFEVLEGEVVEFEDTEVASDEPGVLVGFQLHAQQFREQQANGLEQESWDVESEEVDDFVDRGGACHEVSSAEELQHFDEIVGGEPFVVQLGVEFVDDFEVAFVEELVAGELLGGEFELAAHDVF